MSAATGELSAERMARLDALERWHFWFVARRELVFEWLGRPDAAGLVVDVGGGTGAFASDARRLGYRAIGLDLHHSAAIDVRADARHLPFADGSVDTLLLLDVLEHTEDTDVLAEARRVVRPRGRVLTAVPAHQWLWSDRDLVAGHRRRYSRAGLVRALQASGLEPTRVSGFQMLLLPVLAGNRVLGRLRARGAAACEREEAPGAMVNRLLLALLRSERAIARRVPLPTGSSYLAVATRPS